MLKTAKLCSICRQILVREPHDILKGYICITCEAQKPYVTANLLKKGKPCKLPSFALEFEVAAAPSQTRRALILRQYQFERTYDSTVNDEYKSPIYQNLRVFCKPLKVLHELRDLVNERCGTHLHVSFEPKYELYGFRETIFGPLIAYLSSHEEQTIAFWGRTFCAQAQARLIEGERHVCFNVWSRYPTLEYRLPRFRTAGQYLAVVRFCRNTTAFLEQTLNPYGNQETNSDSLTPEQIGDQVLVRYKKALKVFEATYIPSAQLAERISYV